MMMNQSFREIMMGEFAALGIGGGGSGLGEPGYQGRTADPSKPPGWTLDRAAWDPYYNWKTGRSDDPFYSDLNTAARRTQEPWIVESKLGFRRTDETTDLSWLPTEEEKKALIERLGKPTYQVSIDGNGNTCYVYFDPDHFTEVYVLSPNPPDARQPDNNTPGGDPFYSDLNTAARQTQEPWIVSRPPIIAGSPSAPTTVPDYGAKGGYSIEPPPPIRGGTSDALYFNPGWWQGYQNSRQAAQKAGAHLDKIKSVIVAPLAYLEEGLLRPVLNVPHSALNNVITAGQHLDRGSLWLQQDEWAEAAAEGLEAVADLALAFLEVGTLLESLGFKGAPSGGRQSAPRASLAGEIPSSVPQEYSGAVSKAAGDSGGMLGPQLKSTLPSAPKAYSVALEVSLTPGEVPTWVSDAGRRTRHRDIGQKLVYELVDGWNNSLNPEERELGKRMNELLKNSNEWHLHHVPERAGFLELVRTDQHQAAEFQDLFHPLVTKESGRVGRVGGFYFWGRDY